MGLKFDKIHAVSLPEEAYALIQPGLYTHKEMPHAIHAGTL